MVSASANILGVSSFRNVRHHRQPYSLPHGSDIAHRPFIRPNDRWRSAMSVSRWTSPALIGMECSAFCRLRPQFFAEETCVQLVLTDHTPPAGYANEERANVFAIFGRERQVVVAAIITLFFAYVDAVLRKLSIAS